MRAINLTGRIMMQKKWLVGVLLLGLTLLSAPAYAVQLTNWNVTELNLSGDYVEVIIGTNGSGTKTTLSVQWISVDPAPPTGIGIDKFGFNSNIGIESSGCPTGWICGGTNQTMDGFGSFMKFEQDPGGNTGISSPVVFTLAGLATFTPNDHGAKFAAHVRYSNSCSGFVSDGTTTSGGSNTNCSRKVPEPSTLFLLGSGILSIGVAGSKLAKKKKK